jgi:hypothetical protein
LNDFYAKKSDLIGVPSQFSVMSATEADKSRPIVDSWLRQCTRFHVFGQAGFQSPPCDLSTAAITDDCEKEGGPGNDMKADFNVCDVSVPEDVQAVVNKARGEQGGNLNLYNRFSCTLDDEQ